MTLYIKKLWSLNPTKCKFIPLKKALKEYSDYIRAYIDFIEKRETKYEINMLKIKIKTFEQWRTTEI